MSPNAGVPKRFMKTAAVAAASDAPSAITFSVRSARKDRKNVGTLDGPRTSPS